MRILTNFPYSPFTNKTGSSQRFLQNMRGLQELGHDITIWSISTIPEDSSLRWKVEDLEIGHDEGFTVKLTDGWNLPSHFLKRIDGVWVNYYNRIDCFDEFDGPKWCDQHDLLTVHSQINNFLKIHLGEINGKKTFQRNRGIYSTKIAHPFAADIEEIRAYKKCNCTIAISSSEKRTLDAVGVKTHLIPYNIFEDHPISDYSEQPIFIGSDNLLNLLSIDILGYLIAPAVQGYYPDFEPRIVGDINKEAFLFGSLSYLGYQSNVENVFRTAAFGLCPMLFGTGEKIKIYEMMSHGLPVVAFHSQIGDAPIDNGVTGFRCFSVEEFIEGCKKLWHSQALRIDMGLAAKEAVRNFYSKEQHLKDLETILII